MPIISIDQADYDWFMGKRKTVCIPGKPQKFESAASLMKRIHEFCKEGFV